MGMATNRRTTRAVGEQSTLKPRCIKLSDEHCKLLRMWGRGNLSAGLRWLIEVAAPMVFKEKK